MPVLPPNVTSFDLPANGKIILDGVTPNTIVVHGTGFLPTNCNIKCWDLVTSDHFIGDPGPPDTNPVPTSNVLYFTFTGTCNNTVSRRHKHKKKKIFSFRPTTIFVTVTNNPTANGGPAATSNTVKLDAVPTGQS